jgi:ferredoxin-thioredoxin reductase catalytic subunit
MNKEELIASWHKFADQSRDFSVNSDEAHVAGLAEGELINEQKFGFKLCPCRLRDGSRQRDLELICPCNFKAQDNWAKLGRCWCGLFVKR